MASIEKRPTDNGKSSYRVKVRLKGYPTQTATFERLTDAKNWAKLTEVAIKEGRHFKTVEAKRHTVAELIDRYIKSVLSTKSVSSQNAQTGQLLWWREQLGDYMLADITPALLAECRDDLSEGQTPRGQRTPATVVRYMAALSHAFATAVKEWGWMEDNPFRKVRKPKEPGGRVRFLSDEERDRLLQVCRESYRSDLYPAVVLALSTGARKMEIIGLSWNQIDLDRGAIRLDDPDQIKNKERRTLPLTGHALEIMRERSKIRRLRTDLVFPSPVMPKQPVDLRRAWGAALKEAQIDNFRWHDLRHSAASYLAMNGASMNEIAEVLGHKTLQMVKRYSHLSDSHVAGVVSSMNEKIFG